MKGKNRYSLLAFAALALLLALQWFQGRQQPSALDQAPSADGVEILRDAFASHQSKIWVETEGVVSRLLPDDNKGSRHQRFILKVGPTLTVLVAHNIDLARRVPLRKGDAIRIRGRYEWNPRGGVLHWTHHDPRGRIKGGWIELKGKRYAFLGFRYRAGPVARNPYTSHDQEYPIHGARLFANSGVAKT